MSARAIVLLIALLILFAVLGVGRMTVDAIDPAVRVKTTTDTTPTTVWPEAMPELPDGFDPVALAPKPRPTAKARTAPTAVATIERPAAVGYDIAALEQIIRDGFARFGAHVAEEAVDQAWCETGGTLDPNSTGSEGEVGLLQIHPKYHSGRAAKFGWTMADLYDPAKNVVVAADIYSESGWGPWTCQP